MKDSLWVSNGPDRLTLSNEKTRNGKTWTEGRFKGFITSALRSASRRWPPKYETIKRAFRVRKKSKTSGKLAKHYECAICEHLFPQTQIQVDHIIPLGHCESWNEFIEKLFCEVDNLQVLCKTCHKKKTKREQQS